MIYTLVCTDINDYVNWQCDLLEYSWSRVNQPGKLIRLVACEDDAELPVHRHAEVIRTRPTNVHPGSGDQYVCYNRLFSLQQWLEDESIQGSILMLDCDVVFRSPIRNGVKRGQPVGQSWLDFGVSDVFRAALQSTTDVDPDALQSVTWPALIDADDLRDILPRWIEATVAIREQVKAQESDMFGFLVAAQECNLEFELGTTAAFMPWPDDQVAGAPLIHYCQVVENSNGEYLWSKQNYSPWDRVPNAQTAELLYCRDLVRLVDEFARLKNYEATLTSPTIFIAIASYCEPELIDTIQSCIEKARFPENLRFGICHQYDNADPATHESCLDRYSQDIRFKYDVYPFTESQGGCWARNIAQQLYQSETYTLQIDAHTQMVEYWDVILIEMLASLPSDKPLITQSPPLYSIDAKGQKDFYYIDDFSKVHTALALNWSEGGWLEHNQELKSENHVWPRRTRILSGGFVFTSGEWNHIVRQDPKHFYTSEEFALTLRSYTHGYDLFDPSQIVCWHRLHPKANRKYWSDKSDNDKLHTRAIDQLGLLMDGDPNKELGRYGLGVERTLHDFAQFSGIDCSRREVTQAAIEGWPIDLQINPEYVRKAKSLGFGYEPDTSMVDVTVNFVHLDSLELTCDEYNPVLVTLFQALQNRSNSPNDLVYLEFGVEGQERSYFKKQELASIETSPKLSEDFFLRMAAQVAVEQSMLSGAAGQDNNVETVSAKISDDWKIWVWSNVARGCSKDGIFKQMIERGFDWQVVRAELNHEPSVPLDKIVNGSDGSAKAHRYVANAAAQRRENPKLEIYEIVDFLNPIECADLIQVIQSNLQPSTVVDESAKQEDLRTEGRTSSTCCFEESNPQHALAFDVSKRLSKMIGINSSYAEPIQAQLYEVGGEYKAHYDWFTPGTDSFYAHADTPKGGQRTWSVIVYLNDVIAGGETKFENADLTVSPSRGKVVFWNNIDEFGMPSDAALHQACPVIEGQKVILTLWYRSFGEGDMYIRDDSELIHCYTPQGFEKGKLSVELFKKLSTYYRNVTAADKRNEILEGDFLHNDSGQVTSLMIDIPEDIQQHIISEFKPVCEQWGQTELAFSALYGIRVYTRGTSLKRHTDVLDTHIISVIINVGQDVETDWPLVITDHMERHHSICLEPGEVLFYEGARLMHGRPEPLHGDSYANIFLHFSPKTA